MLLNWANVNVHSNCFFVMSMCCIGAPCRASFSLGKALYKLNIIINITTNMSKFIQPIFFLLLHNDCNFSAYLHYESGIFNVNVYIDMNTEFKIVVFFINFLTPGKRVCTHGSEFACRCANFPIKFVFINPTFYIGSGVCLFPGRFWCVRNIINEAPGLCTITCFGGGVALESDLGGRMGSYAFKVN